MSFSVEVLAGIAIELQSGVGHQDRFQRLITTLRWLWTMLAGNRAERVIDPPARQLEPAREPSLR